MFKRMMCTLALGAVFSPASAQDFWQFSYTGFWDSQSSQFQPQWSENGNFAGTDGNANGLLELSELTRFSWESVEYFPVFGMPACMLMDCELEDFSYNLSTGQLNFRSEWTYSDEASYSHSSTDTGDRIYFYGYTWMNPGSSYSKLWTDQTVFSVSPAPVPEPAAMPMLLAGLGVLGVAARRRRRHLD